ncbi:hypothetical protein ABMZ43_04730, partial [Pseudomonas aeruginosa]
SWRTPRAIPTRAPPRASGTGGRGGGGPPPPPPGGPPPPPPPPRAGTSGWALRYGVAAAGG